MQFPSIKNQGTRLIAGATQGIGFALTRLMLQETLKNQSGAQEPSTTQNTIFATYRRTPDESPSSLKLFDLAREYPDLLILVKLDAEIESDYESAAQAIASRTDRIDLVFNCIGFLNDERAKAERQISEFSMEAFLHSMAVNAAPAALFAKHFKNLLRASDHPTLVSISGQIASLHENKLGGWYSYRMAKVAQNMALKTLSIEMGRWTSIQGSPKARVATLHPGTTDTRLSQPFLKTAAKDHAIHSADQSAELLVNLVDRLTPETAKGHFYAFDGREIPW